MTPRSRLLLAGLVLISASAAAKAPIPFSQASACTAREEGYVTIGGIAQWITIAGESCASPVVLFVHGGPGNPLSPYSSSLYSDWEKDFTIVQWDQRGAGRTFGRNPDLADAKLTIAQMTADGVEVAEHLRRRLGKRKLILVGSSWGSVLGVHMAKARPDLFAAFVGVGQLVSYRDNQGSTYRRLLELARAAGDSATVAKVEALGPPPWSNPRNFGIVRRFTRTYEAKTSTPAPGSWWKSAPLYATAEALAAYEGGEEYSYLQFVGANGDGMLSAVDLPSLGSEFGVPFYLIQGSEDLVTTPEVAKHYFDSIRAPDKRYILLEETGHDPNPAMLEAMLELLREIGHAKAQSQAIGTPR